LGGETMFNCRIIRIISGRTVGKRLIIGCNILIFLIAVVIVNREMVKTLNDKSIVPVLEKELPSSLHVAEVTLLEKAEPDIAQSAKVASFSHQKDIWEMLKPWEAIILRYCQEFGVDSDLVRAVLYTESKGDPDVVSSKGALGLMQITPATADFMEAKDIFDPDENIKTGVKYLAWLIKKYDETTALLAYNAGIGMLEQNRIPSETRNFIDKVLHIKNMLKDNKGRTI
jgi:hypothetical protein